MKHISYLLIFLTINNVLARSVHRPTSTLPRITTEWASDPSSKVYSSVNAHYEEYALFKTFNKPFFLNNQLPQTAIGYRNASHKKASGKELSDDLNQLVQEINRNKHSFTHFTVLRDSNFNYRKKCGLLVLKHKQHPFVAKLFMENPQSFVDIHAKGFEPIWFFYLAGGVNRHMTGFTRVKNAQNVQLALQKNEKWRNKVDVPRKWFWHHTATPWIKLTGYNINPDATLTTEFPGTYAVIADAIEAKRQQSLLVRSDRKETMELCNALELAIDPHIDNFLYEESTGKKIIIDTEHFPTVVGLKEKITFENYRSWYSYLAKKCSKNMLFRTKEERRIAKFVRSPLELTY